MTAEEISEVRKSHKALLEEQLAAVPSFEPTAPVPNDQWRTMVWPASGEAKRNPDTGVSEETLRNVGKASVTISPGGFVLFLTLSPAPAFSYAHDLGNPPSPKASRQCPPGEGRSWKGPGLGHRRSHGIWISHVGGL